MSNTGFVSLDVLAAALELPRTWLAAEAESGRIPHLRIGRRRVFDIDSVREVLKARAAAATKSAEEHET